MQKSRRFPGALAALALLASLPVAAQTVANQSSDDTVLKQIIIFGRHGVRSAALPSTTLAAFATRPYPDFGVPTGYLTPHGLQAETLLGQYFHDYLTQQGLLNGSKDDAKRSYFRANSIQRSNISAGALAAALVPTATPPVHSYALGQPDPVFDPISAQIVTLDSARALQEVTALYPSGSSLTSAYSAELSLIRSVLFNYPNGMEPPPPTPAGLVDVTALPIPLTVNTTNVATANVINAGAIGNTLYAADPFVMEYTDGLPLSQVAWGQLSLDQLSQQTRIITLDFNIQIDVPYLNRLESSNAAAQILRSMEQEAYGGKIPGAFSGPHTRLLVINSSDAYVQGVANLLHMHWLLPGYQPDYCAPGGSLVFELRVSKTTGEDIVRIYYTAQTFDQLRNLTPLTLDQPPATAQLLIPGGSKSSTSLDVKFDKFAELFRSAIDFKFVQDPATEVPPGPLTGVPLN